MAITGEAFLEAARRATDLLARNFLKVSCTFKAFLVCCARLLAPLLTGLLAPLKPLLPAAFASVLHACTCASPAASCYPVCVPVRPAACILTFCYCIWQWQQTNCVTGPQPPPLLESLSCVSCAIRVVGQPLLPSSPHLLAMAASINTSTLPEMLLLSRSVCQVHVIGRVANPNVVQAYGVWWFPPMVLNCAAVLLSLAWGLLIFTLSWLRWQSSANGTMVSPAATPMPQPATYSSFTSFHYEFST